jgi:glutathione-regulated potassium-efflux system ancillary protein KefF
MADLPVLLVFAHPYPDRSRANRKLLRAAEGLSGVTVRSLYDLYPNFDIDVGAEQNALTGAGAVVWQHPMYWYSVPSLLKHWFDKVLVRGFAYGTGGDALWGKRCLWVVTTGGDAGAFSENGMHARPFEEFSPVVEQTARFCGMSWEEPLVLHGAHKVKEEVLEAAALDYHTRLEQLVSSALSSVSSSPVSSSPVSSSVSGSSE